MAAQRRRLRYWIVGENWPEGWFLLSLFAGLFFGLSGLIGAVTSYAANRALAARLPPTVVAAVGLALGLLAGLGSAAVLRRG